MTKGEQVKSARQSCLRQENENTSISCSSFFQEIGKEQTEVGLKKSRRSSHLLDAAF